MAAVEFLLTASDADFDLGPSVDEVDRQGDDGQALALNLGFDAVDLGSVQQQFAMPVGNVAERRRPSGGIGGDVEPEEPHLTVVDAAVGFAHLHLGLAKRLHFRAAKHHPALVDIDDGEVTAGATIGGDDLLVKPGNARLLLAMLGALVRVLGSHIRKRTEVRSSLAYAEGVDDRPIGVFDSGFGGLTVARALIDLLPNERLIYVGDTARYPYGNKALEDVRAFSHEITKWFIDEHDVKLVVVACNTASAAALDDLQATYDTPIVGVIDAGVASLLKVSQTNKVAVIGTVGTIGSGAYQSAVTEADDTVRLSCAACPGFVEFVERGELNSDQLRVLAQRLLSPIVDAKVDALLLGCTHYPFLARAIGDVVGRDVVLVSSADETAFQVRAMLTDSGEVRTDDPVPPTFLSSGDVDEFARIGRMLLGPELGDVGEWVPS